MIIEMAWLGTQAQMLCVEVRETHLVLVVPLPQWIGIGMLFRQKWMVLIVQKGIQQWANTITTKTRQRLI